MIAKTWNSIHPLIESFICINALRRSVTRTETECIKQTLLWCKENLPELDRIIAMEKTIEALRDENDSLVAQLKGE